MSARVHLGLIGTTALLLGLALAGCEFIGYRPPPITGALVSLAIAAWAYSAAWTSQRSETG